MIGNEGIVTRALLLYTQYYLMPGIFNPIKPAAKEKNCAIFRQNPHRRFIILCTVHAKCSLPDVLKLGCL